MVVALNTPKKLNDLSNTHYSESIPIMTPSETDPSGVNASSVASSHSHRKDSSNLRFIEFPTTLSTYLRKTSRSQLLGVSGIAILCASSALALMPTPNEGAMESIIHWIGGLGLNTLAGTLYSGFQHVKSMSGMQDLERLNIIAQSLSNDIRTQGKLRIEIGRFLDDLDAFRIAEEVVSGNPTIHGWLLLQIYKDVSIFRNDFDQIHEALAGIKNSITHLQITVDANTENSLEKGFSKSLTNQFEFLSKAIESLTEDQYQIIQFLKGRSRVAISGCAGSGKTLIALEKAVRLDSAGFRTLLLCHSPYLAQYIRKLTARSGLVVYDFSSWIRSLLGENQNNDSGWSHFEEPLDAEVEAAFDKLDHLRIDYDAIIVDEGQDFRELWWVIIEAALASPETSILYVFHDDNQALLTRRLTYPVKEAPFSMSRNCRNGGDIFEVVRRFHDHAPDPSFFLTGQGQYSLFPYRKGNEIAIVRTALGVALSLLQPIQITLLTTEEVGIGESILNGVEVAMPSALRWQDAVNGYLGPYVDGPINFSEGDTPTKFEVDMVVREARNALSALVGHEFERYMHRGRLEVKWKPGFQLAGIDFLPYRPRSVLAFFANPDWGDELPQNSKLRVTPMDESFNDLKDIPLYKLSSFKGLESDGIILFTRSPAEVSKSIFYVGLSRAKLLLHVVASEEIIQREPLLRKV